MGKDFSILFSKQVGSLVSIRYSGREMIAVPPAPLFWRATTDNDKGTSLSFTAGAWYAASLARKCIKVELQQTSETATVTFEYMFSIHSEIRVRTAYTVYADGTVRVHTGYKGAEGLPNLPIVALSFKMSSEYNQSEWYAMGPEENYIDRACGARLAVFSGPVDQLPSRYLVPQESGNRTGVRSVKITDANGLGLMIKADPQAPVECNVSPYSAFELEQAYHHWEPPEVHYTVVTVAGRQMGVGGDDSWGAPVHDEYLIPSHQDLEFEFYICGITVKE
ncbi:beta-galactosidase small subunit [Paenibacillus sp. P26]|nr:beta-galactosidase small subunit [Paenibacillus sp. P26]